MVGGVEIPNPRHPVPNKSQVPIPKRSGSLGIEIWRLQFVWDLGVGFWNFFFAPNLMS
jgi:hypothetical protein